MNLSTCRLKNAAFYINDVLFHTVRLATTCTNCLDSFSASHFWKHCEGASFSLLVDMGTCLFKNIEHHGIQILFGGMVPDVDKRMNVSSTTWLNACHLSYGSGNSLYILGNHQLNVQAYKNYVFRELRLHCLCTQRSIDSRS